ncbi:nuclear pore complex subunit [Scheffersomyces coipomensis]|uniref:nuclear pore complex subunit n=1 Tax=Scheffersomyces coipomensis TaxID=1788519 RepID=UPI00315D86EC
MSDEIILSKENQSAGRRASYQQFFQDGFQNKTKQESVAYEQIQINNQKSNQKIVNEFIAHKRIRQDENDNSSQVESSELDSLVDMSQIHNPHEPTSSITIEPVVDKPHITIIDDSTKAQFMIEKLLAISANFLKAAHKSVLNTNSKQGMVDYNNTVELSIKALLMILTKYNRYLNPYLESTICLKVATILFNETLSIELADEYVNKAIDIASRNNIILLKFEAEYLQVKILQSTNMTMVMHYLNEKTMYYQRSGLHEFACLFQFCKVHHLLNTDIISGLNALEMMLQDQPWNNSIQVYKFLFHASQHLHRGSPMQALSDVQVVAPLLATVNIKQLYAMQLVSKFSAYIQCNDIENGNIAMRELSDFVMGEQKHSWKSWKEDGSFDIPIQVTLLQIEYNFTVKWLSSDEFVIMFYYLTGMHLLSEAANGKKKAKKVFERCSQIIEKQLKELTGEISSKRKFDTSQLHKKVIKMKFIKYNIDYYKVWIGFLNSQFKDIKYLNQFMSDFNNGKFKPEEQVVFESLIPKVYYLFAVYYHYMGDLQAAKYHYMKVINLTSGKSQSTFTAQCNEAFNLTFGIVNESIRGCGEFNDLYVYSTFHLLILNQFEIKEISKHMNDKSDEKLKYYHGLNSKLINSLSTCFNPNITSNSFTTNFVSSNQLLVVTYRLVLAIVNDEFSEAKLGKNDSLIQDVTTCITSLQNVTSYPFITNLMNYVIYISATDVQQKNQYFDKCLSVMSNTSGTDNDKTLSIFILKSLEEHFKSTGENERANMAELQRQYFYNTLSDKFKFLMNNIDNA